MAPLPVQIVEVSPRDGLQAEAVVLPTEVKVELIQRLVGAGARRIEVCSFVNPARVPQMADAEAVLAGLGPPPPDVSYIGLVLNRRGFDRAAEAGLKEINIVAAATDTFAQRNQGTTSDGSLAVFEELAPLAVEAGMRADAHDLDLVRLPLRGRGPGEAGHGHRQAGHRRRGVGDRRRRHHRRRRAARRARGRRRRPRGHRRVGRARLVAGPLPQHPQHRSRQRLGGRRGRGQRARRLPRRDRRLPLRAGGDRQHPHRGSRLPARARRRGERVPPR